MRFSRLSKVLTRKGAFYAIGRGDYHHLPDRRPNGCPGELLCGLIRSDGVAARFVRLDG